MAKGRWQKYQRINPKILKIVRKAAKPITSNEIRAKLSLNDNLRLSWKAANGYLNDLADAGYLKKIIIQKKNRFIFWEIKEVVDAKKDGGKGADKARAGSLG